MSNDFKETTKNCKTVKPPHLGVARCLAQPQQGQHELLSLHLHHVIFQFFFMVFRRFLNIFSKPPETLGLHLRHGVAGFRV
jgi:hypothetical protein